MRTTITKLAAVAVAVFVVAAAQPLPVAFVLLAQQQNYTNSLTHTSAQGGDRDRHVIWAEIRPPLTGQHTHTDRYRGRQAHNSRTYTHTHTQQYTIALVRCAPCVSKEHDRPNDRRRRRRQAYLLLLLRCLWCCCCCLCCCGCFEN